MTVWTLEQVRAAEGARAQIVLDESLPDEAREVVARKMFRSIQEALYPYAIEIDPRDCELREVPREDGDPVSHGRVFRMRWKPETRVCELLTGPEDGTLVEVPHAGSSAPILVAVPAPTDWAAPPAEPVVSPRPIEFYLSGWNEAERRWVYTP